MKQKILNNLILLFVVTIISCNQSTNQIKELTQSDTSNKINEMLVDTFNLANKIDIQEYKKNDFQIFEEENFVVKNKYSFELENSSTGDKSSFPYTTYTAYQKKGDYENGIIYRIKIDNIESDYKNISRKDYPQNTKSFMDNYKKNLTNYNIDHNLSVVDNEGSIIYKMSQLDPNSGITIKTVAAFFIHERKSYLVQITSSKDQEKNLKTILNNFKFIK